MAYKYTEEGCFKGKLLKEPPLPLDNPEVQKLYNNLKHITRRWLHNGCAVEEMGRMGYPDLNKSDEQLSAFVWRVYELLSKPQPIANNDGVGMAGTGADGKPVFDPRFVLVALVDSQIKAGMAGALTDYFGFKQLAPFFGNVADHYGNGSRIGLYGLCTTRYIKEKEDELSYS